MFEARHYLTPLRTTELVNFCSFKLHQTICNGFSFFFWAGAWEGEMGGLGVRKGAIPTFGCARWRGLWLSSFVAVTKVSSWTINCKTRQWGHDSIFPLNFNVDVVERERGKEWQNMNTGQCTTNCFPIVFSFISNCFPIVFYLKKEPDIKKGKHKCWKCGVKD